LLRPSAEHEAGVHLAVARLQGIDAFARNIDANGLRYMPDATLIGRHTGAAR
jgi:hypothetical protein